ncbi:MAG: MFS transporter [Acidobacteria bacterium]|nr:MFS transporter [Acidobacteriota bacterium]
MSTAQQSDPRLLRPVCLAVFLDMVAFAIILPVLPFYAMNLGATGLWLGVLLTSYSAAKLVGASVAGRLSDRFGRKPLLVACLLGSGLSFLLTAVSGSLLALALARAVAGLFGGTVTTAQAYVADVTGPRNRARYMGLLGASIGLGFIVGPGLGAALGRYGFVVVTSVAAAVALANGLLATVTLKESGATRSDARPPWSWNDVAAQPASLTILAATFLTLFAFVSMETTLAFVASDEYGLDERGFGMILVYVGLIMILVQGGIVGRLAPRIGERKIAAAGALLLGSSLFLLPFATSFGTAMAFLGTLALGQGLASPTLSTLLSRATRDGLQGGMLGLGQSVASAARAIAPVLAGWLYDQGTSWPFVLAGVAAMLAGAGLARLRSPDAVSVEA